MPGNPFVFFFGERGEQRARPDCLVFSSARRLTALWLWLSHGNALDVMGGEGT